MAIYDYDAAEDNELSFAEGDTITQIQQIDEGWWSGVGPNGVEGLFPATYVELMEEEEDQSAPPLLQHLLPLQLQQKSLKYKKMVLL